jgi:LacI family transcriptional regulator
MAPLGLKQMAHFTKIALIIERSRAYGRGILRGISTYIAQSQTTWRIYSPPPFYLEQEINSLELARQLENWGTNGIMLLNEPEESNPILQMKVPIITSYKVAKAYPRLPVVICNNNKVGEIAVEEFTTRGFHHFAYCGFNKKMWWSDQRKESFCKRLAKIGFNTHCYDPPEFPRSIYWEREYEYLSKWLKALPKPIGLMACNDERAKQIIEICSLQNIRLPEEIAILGVDNDELICNLCYPPLSSIPFNREKVGYEAAKLLDSLMAGKKMRGQRINDEPGPVVVRHSTDILKIEDSEIVKAMKFIYENTKSIIQVDDVVNVTTTSRRCLENKFKKMTGHTIQEQIKNTHLNEISKLLTETNLPISEISRIMGHKDTHNFARYFHSKKGMSPLKYRTKYGKQF